MRVAGNVLWFVFGGWLLALTWILGGLIFAISIIGLPFTRSALEIAKMAAFPFGKAVVHVNDINDLDSSKFTVGGALGFIFNIIWLLTFGWILFLQHLILGLVFCITIIFIPFGVASLKLAVISLRPVGRRIVTREVEGLIRTEKV